MKTNESHSQAPSTQADFIQLLQETLVSRCRSNPAYSLRAFAKQLGLEPSFLSKLLSRKRKPSAAVIKKLSLALSLDPAATDSYLQSTKEKTTSHYKNLALDHFTMISDWYHYAILELIQVEGFQPEAGWIAKKLGINKIQAKDAVERLIRLEMIQIDDNGNYQNISGSNTTVSNEFTAVAFRKLQKQILLQAIDALETVPFELRDQSSMTMAIDPELIPEARQKLKEFRRDLCQFLEGKSDPKKQVYQLSLSLFPVTNIKTKDEP